MLKKRKKKEESEIEKTDEEAEEQDPQVDESDSFRGLMFNNMLTSAMPHTWERTNLDSPRRPPSNRPTTIEDVVCPECYALIEHGHEDGCSVG